MFEDRTFENILEEMLAEVDDSLDKRPGSIIYDALAPAALKLAQVYLDLNTVIEITSVADASDEWLDKKLQDFGIYRIAAVNAIREISFNGDAPPEGTRFLEPSTELYFLVNSDGNAVCETAGVVGNSPLMGSTLIPEEDLETTTNITLGNIIVAGSEAEDDDSYRERFQNKFTVSEANCNTAQIKKWCEEISGVKVFSIHPLWNGDTSVKAVLIGEDGLPLNNNIVSQVQEYIDPPDEAGRQGTGLGLADIGVVFTAIAATPFNINLSLTNVLISTGYTSDTVKAYVESVLVEYLREKALNKVSLLKYNEIFALVASVDGLEDFTNLEINNGAINITIPTDNVGVKGVVSFV